MAKSAPRLTPEMIKARLRESQERKEQQVLESLAAPAPEPDLPEPSPEPKKRSRLHRLADWLNDWHVTRILVAATAIFLIPTVCFMAFDAWMKFEEREARERTKIIAAWQLITTKASGNSGKKWALEYLNNKRESLQGIDLSPRNGGKGEYLRGVSLEEVDLQKANLQGANLIEANLQEARLMITNLQRAYLIRANLQKAILWGANLQKASLTNANLQGAILEAADLQWASIIRADLKGANLGSADLEGAFLQGADLRSASDLTCKQLTQAENWQSAYRDKELACGAEIPEYPDIFE